MFLMVSGYGLIGGSRSNTGMLIPVLKHWDERQDPNLTVDAILARFAAATFRDWDRERLRI